MLDFLRDFVLILGAMLWFFKRFYVDFLPDFGFFKRLIVGEVSINL